MLYSIGIKDGFAQIKGAGRFIKIISAATQLRIQAQDDKGRVLLDTKLRSPMAVELDAAAAVINLYADDQQVEIWYNLQPLEYMQLTAVGATSLRYSEVSTDGGAVLLAPANQRKSLKLLTDTDMTINSGAADTEGWPLLAGIPQELETVGNVYGYLKKPAFDWSALNTTSSEFLPPKSGVGNLIPFNLVRFKNYSFVLSTKTMYRIDAANEAVQVFDNVQYFCLHKGDLVVIRSGGSGAIYRSTDGVNFTLNASVQDTLFSSQLGGASFPSNNKLIGDWLSIPTQGGNTIQNAVNLVTGEVKSSAQRATGTHVSYIYVPSKDVFYWAGSYGILKDDNGVESVISEVPLITFDATENGAIFIKGTDNNLYELKDDVLTSVLTGFGSSGYGFNYLKGSGGNLLVASTVGSTQKIAYVGGDTPQQYTVTHGSGSFNAAYDAEGEQIVFGKSASSSLQTTKVSLPNLPAFATAKIKVLEFII